MKLNNPTNQWIVRHGFYLVAPMETEESGGFIMPTEVTGQIEGVILESGEKKYIGSELVDMEYAVGCKILFYPRPERTMKINEETYYLVAEDEILIGTLE